MLAAGLDGIEKGYKVPDPIEENVYEMGEEERKKRGIGVLPANLLEAIHLTEKSEVVRKALGDHVFDAFIGNLYVLTTVGAGHIKSNRLVHYSLNNSSNH